MVILAAGSGERLGRGPKALVELAGKPMLLRTLEALAANEHVASVVVAAPDGSVDVCERLVRGGRPPVPTRVVAGGATRQESARIGLAALPPELPWVAVTDAARPLTRPGTVDGLLRSLEDVATRARPKPGPCGVIPVMPIVDSVHTVAEDPLLAGPVDRSVLRAAQTPQLFRSACLTDCYAQAAAAGTDFTDEAGLVSGFGGRVVAAFGDPVNFKITYAHDLALAEALYAHPAVAGLDRPGAR